MMKKKSKTLAIALAVVVLAGIGIGYLYMTDYFAAGENSLSIVLYHGNEVVTLGDPPLFSTISLGGEQLNGITHIKFVATVENTGGVPLIGRVIEATPSALLDSFPAATKEILPGQRVTWETQKLDTTQFETYCPDSIPGCGDITFFVKIKQEFTCPVGSVCRQSDGTSVGPGETGTIYSSGTLTYNIQPDEIGVGSTIDFVGSTDTDNSGADPTCLESGTDCTLNEDCCSSVCASETITTETTIYQSDCRTSDAGVTLTCPNDCAYCTYTVYQALSPYDCSIISTENTYMPGQTVSGSTTAPKSFTATYETVINSCQ